MTPPSPLDGRLVRELHRRARADRWNVPVQRFRAALEDAARHAPDVSSLHLEDLALACACAAGHDLAWEHFVREHRLLLYRAADAIDPSGGAREIADGLYADLYGLRERDGERQSLFRYYHGRSSLATWLRAVLAQRHVDRYRRERRFNPLPEDGHVERGLTTPAAPTNPERARYVEVMLRALAAALAGLDARDRLRLGSYYQQNLTLAQVGRMLREHEATVSRHLARTRRAIRADVEARLVSEGLAPTEVSRCFELLLDDVGAMDLGRMLDTGACKDPDRERSI